MSEPIINDKNERDRLWWKHRAETLERERDGVLENYNTALDAWSEQIDRAKKAEAECARLRERCEELETDLRIEREVFEELHGGTQKGPDDE